VEPINVNHWSHSSMVKLISQLSCSMCSQKNCSLSVRFAFPNSFSPKAKIIIDRRKHQMFTI
jgi:hypothetical protein